MKQASKIKKTLNQCIENMSIERHRFIQNPQKDFSRNTKCNISTTAKIILSFESSCLKSELYSFFQSNLPALIRKSTFVQQRAKFSNDSFKNLFEDFNSKFPFKKTFCGLNLVACDGTDVNLPTLSTDTTNFVEGPRKNGNGFYQYHCNLFYNILEDRFMDLELQARNEFNEGRAFISMLEKNNSSSHKTLYICDRNYFSWNLAAHVQKEGQFYLLRLKDIYNESSTVKNMVPSSKQEFDIRKKLLFIRSQSKAYTSKPDQYKCLINKAAFDYIPIDDHTTTYPLEFRIVAIKISEDLYEYLITNLPDTVSLSTLKKLYKMRWNEEVSFKLLKYTCALNWFHSIKRKFIIQEIFARLIMYNMTALILQTIKIIKESWYKHDIKLSFSNAAKVVRMYLTMEMTNKQIETLLLSEKIPIRENRHPPRRIRSQRLNPLNCRV